MLPGAEGALPPQDDGELHFCRQGVVGGDKGELSHAKGGEASIGHVLLLGMRWLLKAVSMVVW
jgi:hypothetical protein